MLGAEIGWVRELLRYCTGRTTLRAFDEPARCFEDDKDGVKVGIHIHLMHAHAHTRTHARMHAKHACKACTHMHMHMHARVFRLRSTRIPRQRSISRRTSPPPQRASSAHYVCPYSYRRGTSSRSSTRYSITSSLNKNQQGKAGFGYELLLSTSCKIEYTRLE